jgi:hypothetical protein
VNPHLEHVHPSPGSLPLLGTGRASRPGRDEGPDGTAELPAGDGRLRLVGAGTGALDPRRFTGRR